MSRRSFLHASAAAAAVTAANKARAAGANERIGAAVVGCRNRGWQNALSFHKSGRFDVLALCDCDEAMHDRAMAALARHAGQGVGQPQFVSDFRRLLDDPKIDVIANATPDHWHALITVLALEAGKHVFVEKPASFNIEDGKAMVRAQRKHPKLVVAVGTQQRSAAHFKEAKAFIDSGGLGRIAFGRAWVSGGRVVVNKVPDSDPPPTLDYDMWVGPAPWHPYNEEKVHYNWHFIRDYGTNDAGNWGAHYLDIVRWYAGVGLPRAVSGFGGKYVIRDEKEWFDTQTAMFHYPELTIVWEMRHWASTGIEGMGTGAELRGEKGTLLIDRGRWTFYPKDGEPVAHPGSTPDEPHMENFADSIAGTAKPSAGIVEGHKTAVLCHLANIATLFNRQIAFDPQAETIVNDPEARALEGREYRSPWKMPG